MDLAKAEVAENPSVSPGMRRLGAVTQGHEESGVHKLFKEEGLVPDVVIDTIDLGKPGLDQFPVIKFSSWIRYLDDTDRLCRQLTGTPNVQKMELVLAEFWNRWRVQFPGHGVFPLADANTLQLERTIPIYSHSDEGRTLKKAPIWLLSCSGAIGRGSKKWLDDGRNKAPLHRNGLGLNYVGSTWSTQFLYGSLLRSVESDHPGCLDSITEGFALDLGSLCRDGLVCKDGKKVWVIHIGTKGDLPALTRLGGFCRSFSHVVRSKSSQRPAGGICHRCLAGKEQPGGGGGAAVPLYPFEDLGLNPAWKTTIGTESPWNDAPVILKHVPLGDYPASDFFELDVWHNLHLGLSKHFVGSAVISICENIEKLGLAVTPSSMDASLQWMTQEYKQFCDRYGPNPWVSDLGRETLQFPASTACPQGKWNKGSASSHLMAFLEDFCSRYIRGRTDDGLLVAIDS